MTKTEYKYDVAISLCKQDVDFANKLVKALNPKLKVFFYEHRQEELISKSGPEAFAKIFKTESRVVIVLSRNEWSDSYSTEIERNAIIDRTSVKNEGFRFLMIIPLVHGELPVWYPSTQIYASPFKFSVEELARFIEFKVADEGGIIKALTVEDRYQNLLDRINEKKSIINLQSSEVAIQSAMNEIELLKKCFDEKINLFLQTETKNSIVDGIRPNKFKNGTFTNNHANITYGNFVLSCEFILPNNAVRSTQDCVLKISLFSLKDLLESEERVFYYTNEFHGWALMCPNEHPTNSELTVLFQNRECKRYDLTNPLGTEAIVDTWFQKLLIKATRKIESYLN